MDASSAVRVMRLAAVGMALRSSMLKRGRACILFLLGGVVIPVFRLSRGIRRDIGWRIRPRMMGRVVVALGG